MREYVCVCVCVCACACACEGVRREEVQPVCPDKTATPPDKTGILPGKTDRNTRNYS